VLRLFVVCEGSHNLAKAAYAKRRKVERVQNADVPPHDQAGRDPRMHAFECGNFAGQHQPSDHTGRHTLEVV
jgi:hypothetical protein